METSKSAAIIATLVMATTVNAQVDIRTQVQFERIKLKSYAEAVNETKDLLFVWVDYENLALFKDLLKQYPKAKHCFVGEFPAIQKGLVLGRKTAKSFDRELDISEFNLNSLNSKEVILKVEQALKPKVIFQSSVVEICET